jgi:hypothetical protein
VDRWCDLVVDRKRVRKMGFWIPPKHPLVSRLLPSGR